jgi:3-oxoacyl-[acyl-carrier-protein] synthase II
MGVAAAQKSLNDARLAQGGFDPDRSGVIYGMDHILTMPEEFAAGIAKCTDAEGRFHLEQWGERGLSEINPLWLLKYLPNMPASHIAIFNEMRGPNNSLTLREAAANLAVAEAARIIARGSAEMMIAGATGTRIHPIRTVSVAMQEEIAGAEGEVGDPAALSRPFDLNRSGMVLGEGAGAIVMESLASAQARGAKIWGEVVGFGSSTVQTREGIALRRTAIANAIRQSLAMARMKPEEVGHIHAHGLATHSCDMEEGQAIADIFSDGAEGAPVTAAKSYFGNLGAAGGVVELAASLLALDRGPLFRTLNYETPDPECYINVVRTDNVPPGESFLNISVTPQGQASVVLVRKA